MQVKRLWKELKKSESKAIITLMGISALGVMAGSLIAPIESRFINLLAGGDKGLVGITFSIGTIFLFIFSVLIGKLSRKYGKAYISIVGLSVGIIYPVLYATSFYIIQYIFGKITWALVAASSSTAINGIFQDLLSQRKRIAELASYSFSIKSLSGTIGAIIGGYIADKFGIVVPYYLIIPLYILSILLFLKWVLPIAKSHDTKSKESNKNVKPHRVIKGIISNPYLLLRLCASAVSQSFWAMEPIVFPLLIYSLTQKNISTGIIFGAMGIVAMLALPLTGRFVDKTSSVYGLKIAMFLYIVSLLLLTISKAYIIFVIGALLLSLAKAFDGPSFAKIEVEHIPNTYRSEYLGYFYAYDALMNALFAIITGYLLNYFNYITTLSFFIAFTIFGFGVGFLLFYLKQS